MKDSASSSSNGNAKSALNQDSCKIQIDNPKIVINENETNYEVSVTDLPSESPYVFDDSLDDESAEPLNKKVKICNKRRRFGINDYNVPCIDLAKKLLGKCLVRQVGDIIVKGKIVETESYLGIMDKASHSFNGRRTKRNEPMFMMPGTCYVYLTHGQYHCFNVSSQGDGAAVLIRSVEPLEGLDFLRKNRVKLIKKKHNFLREFKLHELCNGPAKVCMCFDIDVRLTKHNMCLWEEIWIEEYEDIPMSLIVDCPRIGIDSAGKECASLPLRFYVYKNHCVSKKDKMREIALFA